MTTETQAPDPAQALLVQALEDIIEPFAYIERTLPEGYRLDGCAALQQINSREFYTRIAKEALAAHRAAAIPAPEGAPSDAAVELAAKAVYRLFIGADLHPWVEGGNSLKQDDARRYARAALAAPPTDNNAMGKTGCFPAAERTNAAPQAAPADLTVAKALAALELHYGGSPAFEVIKSALAAPAKAPCTHGAEHCTNTSCERLGECQYMAAPAPQRYSPTGDGGMEIDSLGAWVKFQPAPKEPKA